MPRGLKHLEPPLPRAARGGSKVEARRKAVASVQAKSLDRKPAPPFVALLGPWPFALFGIKTTRPVLRPTGCQTLPAIFPICLRAGIRREQGLGTPVWAGRTRCGEQNLMVRGQQLQRLSLNDAPEGRMPGGAYDNLRTLQNK